jgi:hypothetical protein
MRSSWSSPSRPRRTRHPAQPIRRSHVDFTELQAGIAVEADVVLAQMKALAELERRIGALYTELQPDDVRRTIPGVGRHLAPVLPGVLHTAERCHAERHIRGVSGLFPRRADSGGAEQPGQTITQGGNDRIERALRLAADIARKIDPDLAEIYWRLMTIRGHHHEQALCAVADRLADRIFSVMCRGKPKVLRDRDGREITVAEAETLVAEQYTVPEGIRVSRRANRAAIAA